MAERGTTTVKITLSADPERTVTIPIAKAKQGGAAGTDYSGVPASVTFDSGETAQSFTVTAVQDSVDDEGESVRLTFGELPSYVILGKKEQRNASILLGSGYACWLNAYLTSINSFESMIVCGHGQVHVLAVTEYPSVERLWLWVHLLHAVLLHSPCESSCSAWRPRSLPNELAHGAPFVAHHVLHLLGHVQGQGEADRSGVPVDEPVGH